MKKIISLTAIFVLLLAMTFCYYDSEEDLFPKINSDCQLENLTFNGEISQILQNSCLSCHSNATAAASGNGIRLESYSDFVANLDAVSGAVNFLPGFSPMPKNGSKLSSCALNQLDKWISQGKIEN